MRTPGESWQGIQVRARIDSDWRVEERRGAAGLLGGEPLQGRRLRFRRVVDVDPGGGAGRSRPPARRPRMLHVVAELEARLGLAVVQRDPPDVEVPRVEDQAIRAGQVAQAQAGAAGELCAGRSPTVRSSIRCSTATSSGWANECGSCAVSATTFTAGIGVACDDEEPAVPGRAGAVGRASARRRRRRRRGAGGRGGAGRGKASSCRSPRRGRTERRGEKIRSPPRPGINARATRETKSRLKPAQTA